MDSKKTIHKKSKVASGKPHGRQLMDTTRFKGFSLAILAAIFWGISGTFAQFLFLERNINIEWLITVRMLASGILLLLFSKMRGKEKVMQVLLCLQSVGYKPRFQKWIGSVVCVLFLPCFY